MYKSNSDAHELEGRVDVFARLAGSAKKRKQTSASEALGINVSGLAKPTSQSYVDIGGFGNDIS